MAQAILLKDVENLGEAGQAVDVSPGYLRNFLLPRKLAQPATAGALEEAQRARRDAALRGRGGAGAPLAACAMAVRRAQELTDDLEANAAAEAAAAHG